MHGSRRRPPSGRLTVLFSFPAPHAASNPYVVQLAHAVAGEPDVEVLFFSWRTALLAHYDVFHTQWPELMFSGRSRGRALARRVLFLALVARLWVLGTPMVRTLHNVTPHERKTWLERRLIRLTDRRTAGWIRLNPATAVPGDRGASTILHGHYRSWFASHPVPEVVPGSMLFAGQIRDYKNVPALIAAFRELPGAQYSLRVVGKPAGPSMAADLTAAARGDERITFSFGHLDDAHLVQELGRAEMVVLPYSDMHNSGAALLALSLDRPIVVPENEVTAALSSEVGDDWVQRYPGALAAADLATALTGVRRLPPGARPDLSGREWTDVGEQLVRIYRAAVRARGRGRPVPGDQLPTPVPGANTR